MSREGLTELQFFLLNALVTAGPSYPYRIGRHVEQSAGKGLVSLGALYKALHRLEDSGYVESRWESVEPREVKRPRRRIYTATGLGERALRTAAAERPALWQPAISASLSG